MLQSFYIVGHLERCLTFTSFEPIFILVNHASLAFTGS